MFAVGFLACIALAILDDRRDGDADAWIYVLGGIATGGMLAAAVARPGWLEKGRLKTAAGVVSVVVAGSLIARSSDELRATSFIVLAGGLGGLLLGRFLRRDASARRSRR